ncbi:DUF4595 domain-containing protein [Ravibacter arvi]
MKTTAFFISFFLVMSFACKPEKNPEPEASCEEGARLVTQKLGDIPIAIEYDNEGRISKVFRSDGQGLIENYQYTSDTTAVITRNFRDGGVGNTFNIVLNNKGYIKRYVTVGAGDNSYTITYLYDADGYLSEYSIKFTKPAQTLRSVYTYKDGNRTGSKSYTDGKLTYTEDYAYTEDLNKADVIFNGNQPGILGHLSKNLLSSIKRTYPDGKKESYSFVYKLNKTGYAESVSQVYVDQANKKTEQTNIYTYVCP